MRFTRLRFSTQLLILTVGTATIATILLVLLAIVLTGRVVQNEGNQRLTALTEATAALITPRLSAQDTAGIQQILAAVVRDEGLDGASLIAPDGTTVVEQSSAELTAEGHSADDRDFALSALRDNQLRTREDTDQLVDIAVPITVNGQTIGVLLGQSSTSAADDELFGAMVPQMTAGGLGVALLAGLAALALSYVMAKPLRELALAAQSIGQGQLEALPSLRGSAEITLMAGAFNQMVGDLCTARGAVAEQQATLETQVRERTAALEQTLVALRTSVAERDQLNATVRELASPIIPVFEDVVVMPLIGVIDTQRAAVLIEMLLRGVEHYRARVAILDVTGVPIIDTYVARTLLDAANAVKLLGTQTILVGLRPELAQTIVGLGLDLRDLITQSDLQRGISYAVRQHNGQYSSVSGDYTRPAGDRRMAL